MAASGIKKLGSNKVFGGVLSKFEHTSSTLGNLTAKFNVFEPQNKSNTPVLYWLSGLTCTEDNFAQKAGAFRLANELNITIVMPDTSPRGAGCPEEDDSWDFGTGAGFYVNATTDEYKDFYNMYDYVTKELIGIINEEFDVNQKQSVFGHSMGGHGALVCYLKNPGLYESCSAFSPIVNPLLVPWGEKAFSKYLGSVEAGAEYDACQLVSNFDGDRTKPMLVSQGTSDNFLERELKTENFAAACEAAGQAVDIRMEDGYDHSYFFISTFAEDHIRFHAQYLC